MMTTTEGPKLFDHKPKKSQLKQSMATDSPPSSSAAMASQPSAPPPPPPPPKESFARRYKFILPLFLAANLSVGAYLFMKTKKKDTSEVDEVAPAVPSTPVSTPLSQASTVTEKPLPSPTVEPLKREPIPETQQRELFKWILEERRKLKPKDPEEKKRIDEEKAILKQFIRAKSIPTI